MAVEEKISVQLLQLISGSVANSIDLRDMAQQATHLLVSSLGIKGSTLFVLNPDTDELEIVASSGLSIEYLNKGPVLISKSIDKKDQLNPVVIPDVTGTDRLQYPEHAQQEGIQAIISLPIKIKGHMLGVLRLYHYESWEVSDQDLSFLNVLTDHLGLAMMYIRLLSSLRIVKESVADIHPVWLA